MELTRPEIALDGAPPVRVKMALAKLSDDRVDSLSEVLRRHPGDSPVFVHLERPERTTVLRLADDFRVDATNGLFAELRILLGHDCIC